jgi:hypothetical protein
MSAASPTDPRPRTGDVAGLVVADVMHAGIDGMPSTATVGDLRDWFAVSTSRRLAVLCDDGRYSGSLTPADVGAGAPADEPALALARESPRLRRTLRRRRVATSCSRPTRAACPSSTATAACTASSR